MKAISLFSGAGGMDFGAAAAGATIVFANDIDVDAVQTHAKYFPNTDVVPGDVSAITDVPEAELLIGGYPCQSFSRGGNRNPHADERTYLFKEFSRILSIVNPSFFLAENVDGLRALQSGHFLDGQIQTFDQAGRFGYNVSWSQINAKQYGVPQSRKRVFIVGVRKDLGLLYKFPPATHGTRTKNEPDLKPFTSHGEVIKDLPLWPEGEYYERPHDPEGNFSWYYMSRNRKAPWDEPSFTMVANWRHITLHPASPTMTLTWSNLKDGWKQRWDFSGKYEHTQVDPSRPVLERPRRLSWRECARIQGFPKDFEPLGSVESKFRQIGNAVPPLLARTVIEGITTGSCLVENQPKVCQRRLFELE